MLIEHIHAVINCWIPLRGWVRMIRTICTICRVGIMWMKHYFLWLWDLLDLYNCTCVPGGIIWTPYLHVMWRICTIDHLHTPTCSLPREPGMFRIFSTCMPGGIWLISMTCKVKPEGDICLITIFLDVYLSRLCLSCTISTVWSGWELSDLPICTSLAR